jgi:putative PIN family toxin of toxin-antitoxin system
MKSIKRSLQHGKSVVRVVLDANVLVQASLAPFGPANGIIAFIFTGQIRPLFDERMLAEYEELTRPQFAFRRQAVERMIRQLRLAGEFVTAFALPKDQARHLPDATDAAFLEVAISAKADVLISSNVRHFPSAACAGMPVIPPVTFLQTYVRLK